MYRGQWTPPKPKKTIVFRIDAEQLEQLAKLVQNAKDDGKHYWPRVTTSFLVRQAIKLGLVELAKEYPAPKKRDRERNTPRSPTPRPRSAAGDRR